MKIVDRPGYFGQRRPEKIEYYNAQYGIGNWFECWEFYDKILDFNNAVKFYDDSYFLFLHRNKEILEYVCSFEECYDDKIENILCGTTHDETATPRHIQDVAVRRAVADSNRTFKTPASINDFGYLAASIDTNKFFVVGNNIYDRTNLLEIRAKQSNGFILNPGRVPFSNPDAIISESIGGRVPKWVSRNNSVETFWQRNKVIVIKE